MAKLKSKITIVLALFLFSSFAVMLCSMFARRGNVETYKITYVAVENGEVTDIAPFLYKKGGKYPTEYVSGKETYVDDLLGKMTAPEVVSWWELDENELPVVTFGTGSPVQDPNNPYQEYEFWGWYLDKECTQAFDGKIEKTSVGNITLYADIAVAFWTKYY